GIRRTTPAPIDLPLLRALGPVGVEMFAGVLTEERGDFDHPGLIGMRVAVAPAPGLEIGLNRALQLCGAGRPCSLGLVVDGLIGLGNRDNSGTPDEPGNQLAGFDVSYRRQLGAVAAHAYLEMAAEDENNLIVEQFGRLAGIELSGAAGPDGARWQLHAEAVDTLAVKLFGGKDYPGSFYNHHIYTDGFRYRRRALGSSLDGDGRMLVVSGSVSDANDRRAYASWRNVDLNRSGSPRNPLTPAPVSFDQLTGGLEIPALAGRLRLEARVADGSAAAGGVVPRAQLELSFQIRR
ncbi:MAG: capsule assembly Wzi family protein, partial [Sphingomonadaceae bacterium]|nr:capsule assembly Wzi family protein [Sphingomonadaceae bacterium]